MFKGELRWVRRNEPGQMPCYPPPLVLQQAVDVGGPYENLHWIDVPIVKEDPAIDKAGG